MDLPLVESIGVQRSYTRCINEDWRKEHGWGQVVCMGLYSSSYSYGFSCLVFCWGGGLEHGLVGKITKRDRKYVEKSKILVTLVWASVYLLIILVLHIYSFTLC
jgi:hypothetical protein